MNSAMSIKDINLRATNPDNIFDIKGIIDLFNITYGSTFPNHEVYIEDFWKERIGNRFISIVAERNNKIIGHIACSPHKDDPKNVQIIMPVVIPCNEEQEILNMMWDLVEELAKKKSWKIAYKFITSYPERMENTISMIGNFYDSAIYPGHNDSKKKLNSFNTDSIKSQTNYPILYSQHTFNSKLIKEEYYYSPSAYNEIIANFYRGLQIPRKQGNLRTKNTFKVLEDVKPVEIKSYRHTGLCRAYITPSLLSSYTKDALKYDKNRFSDALYYINLLDPKCPKFCEFLESLGFSFCGIIPLIDGSDYIIYSPNLSNLKECHFTKEESENLRALILENENISKDFNYDKSYKDNIASETSSLIN